MGANVEGFVEETWHSRRVETSRPTTRQILAERRPQQTLAANRNAILAEANPRDAI